MPDRGIYSTQFAEPGMGGKNQQKEKQEKVQLFTQSKERKKRKKYGKHKGYRLQVLSTGCARMKPARYVE